MIALLPSRPEFDDVAQGSFAFGKPGVLHSHAFTCKPGRHAAARPRARRHACSPAPGKQKQQLQPSAWKRARAAQHTSIRFFSPPPSTLSVQSGLQKIHSSKGLSAPLTPHQTTAALPSLHVFASPRASSRRAHTSAGRCRPTVPISKLRPSWQAPAGSRCACRARRSAVG